MQPRWATFWCGVLSYSLAASIASAQLPYPTAAQASGWGGQAMPAQVPYQPTLVSDAAAPAGQPVMTYGLPPGGTAAAIVGQPTHGGAYTLQGPVALPPEPGAAAAGDVPTWQPYRAPPILPQEPLFPDAPSSGLRPLPRPADARDGLFQKAKFTATWIPQLNDESLG